MNVNIDPRLSIFDLVERSRQASVLLYDRQKMVQICTRLEQRVVDKRLEGMVFAGFQEMSKFEDRHHMYEDIAFQTDQTYIFAYHDVAPPQSERINYVSLREKDALRKDWFVVFHGPTYFSALVGKQQSADAPNCFKAIWTFDLDIIRIISDWLVSLLGINALPYLDYDHEAQIDLMDLDMDDYLDLID